MSDRYPDCTKEERESINRNICPDCGGFGFLKGPEGGMTTNIKCQHPLCGAEFNVCLPWFAHRLPKRQDGEGPGAR